MAWSDIIGQERVKKILQRAITERRVAHAYCFWGNEGIGKDALALEFAKVLNCEHPRPTSEGIEACDGCKSCRLAAQLQHPNIRFVFSLPAAKSEDKGESPLLKLSDEQISHIQEQLRLKSENPYHNINIPNANQIRIASIRDVKKSISLSASQAGRRVIIISEADAMTMEAANAFLKTLEEPHAQITIILTTSRREQVLSTILSRCQQMRCSPLADEDIAAALAQQFSMSAGDAQLTARLADGSYSRAIELLRDDVKQLRMDVVNFLRILLTPRNHVIRLTHEINVLAGERDRIKVEKMLIILLLWIRDAYILASTGNPDNIVNMDQAVELRNFVQKFGAQGALDTATRHVERAVEYIRRNGNVPLVLVTMALEIRTALMEQG